MCLVGGVVGLELVRRHPPISSASACKTCSIEALFHTQPQLAGLGSTERKTPTAAQGSCRAGSEGCVGALGGAARRGYAGHMEPGRRPWGRIQVDTPSRPMHAGAMTIGPWIHDLSEADQVACRRALAAAPTRDARAALIRSWSETASAVAAGLGQESVEWLEPDIDLAVERPKSRLNS